MNQPKKNSAGSFSAMLRAKEPTARELMSKLDLAYRSLQEREKFPEKLTIETLFRVAAYLNLPLDEVVRVVINEVLDSGRMPKVRTTAQES